MTDVEASTTGQAGVEGYAPVLTIGITEHEKYRRLWMDHPEYREVSPGENIATLFLSIARPKPDSEVIDFGTGTGRGSMMLAFLGGCIVHMIDFVDGCMDEDVKNATVSQPTRLTFTQHNLTKPIPLAAQYGYCTDVMEHIPPVEVDKVLFNILKAAQHVFFQIACEDDVCGKLIGHPLHLSIHPFSWWLKKFKEFGAEIHYAKDYESHVVFYVSSWQNAKEVVKVGKLNVEEQRVVDNVKHNVALGFMQAMPMLPSPSDIMILGGGPSLPGQLETIKQLRSEGVKLITLNGSYNWALDNELKPSAQIVVDAREFNNRFTRRVIDDCRYLMASQVDPSTLEDLPRDRTYIWHTTAEMIRKELDDQYPIWYGVQGGSTVMLRAIPLLVMLGFRRFHLFGFDSCLSESKEHHAYSQPENDTEQVMSVVINGGPDAKRVFKCHSWMLSQANEFMDLIKFMGDVFELEVYGDGLIAWILKTGASAADIQPSEVFELS